jgi:hypothetical protein
MRPALLALIVLIAACRDAPPARATLGEYLGTLAGADAATRAREVAAWQLDGATWQRTVVATYAVVHGDYARAFETAAPALVAQLATRGAITTRPHFAGDLKLTLGQAQARWALPVQYPSEIAELDGVALDAVFLHDGQRWRAITGIDGVLRAKAAAFDPACAAHLRISTSKKCSEVGWVIADAALRADRPRFDHACSLAANLCAQ